MRIYTSCLLLSTQYSLDGYTPDTSHLALAVANEHLWYLILITKAQHIQDNIAIILSAAFKPLANAAGMLMSTVPAMMSTVPAIMSAVFAIVSAVTAVVSTVFAVVKIVPAMIMISSEPVVMSTIPPLMSAVPAMLSAVPALTLPECSGSTT